jgi:hypothetical protein
MKVNFSIFPGQHSHQILKSLDHSGQFSRLQRGTDSISTSLKQLENVLQEERYKIPLQTVQNLFEYISRRTAALLKKKGGPTPY